MLFPSLPSLSALLLVFSLCGPATLARNIPVPVVHKNLARGADSAQWTNGQRLAAGLPPHAPRKLKRATPTEPNVAKRHAPSPSPSLSAFANLPVAATVTRTGRIEARTVADDTSLGFLTFDESGVSLKSGSDGNTDGGVVVFTTSGSTPFDIATTGDSPLFLGGSGTIALSTGSTRTATLSAVPQTSPHARPMATGGESAIWALDTSTQKLVPFWVNPDGAHAKTTLAYSAADGALLLTGDIDAYNQAHPDAPVAEVALYYVGN